MYSGSGFIRPARVPQLNASKSLVTAQPRRRSKIFQITQIIPWMTIDQIRQIWLTFYEALWSSSSATSPSMRFNQTTNSVMKFIKGNQSVHDVHSVYQFVMKFIQHMESLHEVHPHFRGPQYYCVIKVHTFYQFYYEVYFIHQSCHISINSLHRTPKSLPELVKSLNPSKCSQSTNPVL